MGKSYTNGKQEIKRTPVRSRTLNRNIPDEAEYGPAKQRARHAEIDRQRAEREAGARVRVVQSKSTVK